MIGHSETSSLHPFPARMAPEVALEKLRGVKKGSTVVDPMCGSGTVLRQAALLGMRPVGFDLDPLAVLLSRANAATVNPDKVRLAGLQLADLARHLPQDRVVLPWIDDDKETQDFIRYWFAPPQTSALRKLAWLICNVGPLRMGRIADTYLRIALSRIVVTKQRGASLAWDVSHSRPHKVREHNDFDVIDQFARACDRLATIVENRPIPLTQSNVYKGDARLLTRIRDRSAHVVLTSPPYLNAIDYMRGHRLALVWLGYSLSELRGIRSRSIGAERAAAEISNRNPAAKILSAFGRVSSLPRSAHGMLVRYAKDLLRFTGEIFRILRPDGNAHLVIGNSRLRGVYINNAQALQVAAELSGLVFESKRRRSLPISQRYLPVSNDPTNTLSRRMREEIVISFRRPRK